MAELSELEARELLTKLLQKNGNWVDWGKACQRLQQSGYTSGQIFEETGFQSSQQNLVIVAAQVYETIVNSGISAELQTYLTGPRSDILYEFRILNQQQRTSAAELAREKKLTSEDAHEVARAIKEIARQNVPEGFSSHAGDAVAYQCWKTARQKKDLQERSRLIAKGLKYAHSASARQHIEKLLSDFTVVPGHSAPLLPVYRWEAEEQLPCIIPVAGVAPLSVEQLQAVEKIASQPPFGTVNYTGTGTLVPIPGWQVILKAADPVGFFCNSQELPQPLSGKPEQVLVVIDRGLKTWDINSYFASNRGGKVELRWWEAEPDVVLLGQLILVLRPKKILDENILTQPWQMDD